MNLPVFLKGEHLENRFQLVVDRITLSPLGIRKQCTNPRNFSFNLVVILRAEIGSGHTSNDAKMQLPWYVSRETNGVLFWIQLFGRWDQSSNRGTVPFRSIRASRVTGGSDSTKCHGGHGHFGGRPKMLYKLLKMQEITVKISQKICRH